MILRSIFTKSGSEATGMIEKSERNLPYKEGSVKDGIPYEGLSHVSKERWISVTNVCTHTDG